MAESCLLIALVANDEDRMRWEAGGAGLGFKHDSQPLYFPHASVSDTFQQASRIARTRTLGNVRRQDVRLSLAARLRYAAVRLRVALLEREARLDFRSRRRPVANLCRTLAMRV